MTAPGALIAFEGVDASGLTTHSRRAVSMLSNAGLPSVYTKEPTTGPIGRVIREMLAWNHENHDLLALLFAADRVWHYRLDPGLPGGGIRGAIMEGYIVVSDRYKYSSMAYQGSYIGVDLVDKMNACAPEADIMVFIDLPVEIILRRLSTRGRRELYEEEQRIRRIKRTFESVIEIARNRGVRVLRVNTAPKNSEMSIEEASKIIVDNLLKELNSVLASSGRLSLQPLDNRCPV
ncbi:MAG: dTMP kinase [Desulfurococcales archaeon]|nr:dTMP kinase [Desulfurococcales archaeon]